MPKIVTHEAIAANLLNLNHCSAAGPTLPWQHHLTNTEKLLGLLVMRMEKDWTSTAQKTRKAWGVAQLEPHRNFTSVCIDMEHIDCRINVFQVGSCLGIANIPKPVAQKTGESLQKICGGYLACVERFEAMVPAGFAAAHLPEIEKTFLVLGEVCYCNQKQKSMRDGDFKKQYSCCSKTATLVANL